MGPVDGKVLLSFVWAVPLSPDEAERIFARGQATGSLAPLDDTLAQEWLAAEDFLFQEAGPPDRYLFSSRDDDEPVAVGIGDKTLPCRLFVTRRAGSRAMTLIAAITVNGRTNALSAEDVDLSIALLQSLCGHRCEHVPEDGGHELHGRYLGNRLPSARDAIAAAFDELVADLGVTEGLDRRAWCVELRGSCGNAGDSARFADPRTLYGLATGDEGWRFVPADVAADRLGAPWRTRSFVAIYTMASGIVCVNNKGSDYVDHQNMLTQKHFGRLEPYFALDTEVAGLEHGPLLVLERVLIRLAMADQWLHQVQPLIGSPRGTLSVDDNRLLRGSLDNFLLSLNSLLLPEVDTLEHVVITKMGVERIVSRLDRQAEAIDEETRYSYESQVSVRITRLTVITIILTVVTVVLGVLQVLVSL